MDTAEMQARLAALEGRMRLLEDHVELLRLINRWGPAVDTGDPTAAASLWTDDGVLESDLSHLEGPGEVAAMVRSDGQQALIDQGCAHIQGFPVLRVDGDTAVGVGYSRVYRRRDDSHEVWRVSANRWEFRRTASGWRVTRRVNSRIDGGSAARDVLAAALE